MAKKKTPAKTRGKTAKRAGRPSQRKIGPDELDLIEKEVIRGRTVTSIAAELDVHPSTVQQHVDLRLRPAWQRKLRRGAEIELAKIDHLEAIAWERMDHDLPAESRETVTEAMTEGGADLELVQRVTSTLRRRGSTAWVQVIQWCIETRCKLLGHFAAVKVKAEDTGLRVAGMTPNELDAKMLGQLLDKVAEKQRQRAAMRRDGNLN